MAATIDFLGEFKAATEEAQGVHALKFTPITEFSTHFAEYAFRDDDLIVHLFPRAGMSDRYYPADHSHGYIPGRFEEKATVTFPGDMRDTIKAAADDVWLGDVAIDLVPELGAYAVQFIDAKNTVKISGDKFMDKFCEAIDTRLD